MLRLGSFLLCVGLGLAAPAAALILASGDGLGNTTPPPDDPGWANLGARGGTTAIYLGDGWVMSAKHVGQGDVWFENNGTYLSAARPAIILDNTPGGPQAEVKLWRLMADPVYPSLDIATSTPAVGAEVIMIGRGRARGIPVSYQGRAGWQWGPGGPFRWGTNRVSDVGVDVSSTRSLGLLFSLDGDTADEAIAASGDSGGAVFHHDGIGWTLAGLMWAIETNPPAQPQSTAIDQNRTWAADLAYFSLDIAAVTAERACSDGSDDDGDGLVDYPADPGCQSPSDAFETDAHLACDDGFDNDGDGLRDVADPGCLNPHWPRENPGCDDDADNDGDGGIDWDGGSGGGTPDSFCVGHPYRGREERRSGCGLGFELALLIPLLARVRWRTRRV